MAVAVGLGITSDLLAELRPASGHRGERPVNAVTDDRQSLYSLAEYPFDQRDHARRCSQQETRSPWRSFRERILKPPFEGNRERNLTSHIQGIAYSSDFPIAVDLSAERNRRARNCNPYPHGIDHGLTYLIDWYSPLFETTCSWGTTGMRNDRP